MLVQMPRGSSDQPKKSTEEGGTFEAALRRDLASAPVISYDSTLGGWQKRAFDVFVTVFTAPVWAPLLLIAAAYAKLRHRGRVFHADERVGYGGYHFEQFGLWLRPPTASIEPLRPTGEEAPLAAAAPTAEGAGAKWRRLIEALPRLLNVLRGDMSLVGPTPLTHEELSVVTSGKRHYLSARPGVICISGMLDADQEHSQYRLYSLNWSLGADTLILWDALKSLRDRGELWQPNFKIKASQPSVESKRAALRRRSTGAS
jgi:exopolysaccharide production protein ExoY